MNRYYVEVSYEYRQTFPVMAETEDAAIQHALLDAREDLAEAIEVGVPTSDFEVYLQD